MGDDVGHADESREESERRGNTWKDIAPVCAIQRAAGGGTQELQGFHGPVRGPGQSGCD